MKSVRLLLISIIFTVSSACTMNATISSLSNSTSQKPDYSFDVVSPKMQNIVVHAATYGSLEKSPKFEWEAAEDDSGGSGILGYELCLGSAEGLCDLKSWFFVGDALYYKVSDLNLAQDVRYFPSVRAIDRNENKSESISSAGWLAKTATLNYMGVPSAFGSNEVVSISAPAFAHFNPIQFSIQPPLPSGLSMSAQTGQISGSTTSLGNSIIYTVTASDGDIEKTATISFGIVENITVAPVYPTFGAEWNDWVKATVVGASPSLQTDTVCSGTEVIRDIQKQEMPCVHGGDRKKFVLTSQTSCANLVASDNLAKFDWTCKEVGGVVTVYSKLKQSTRLYDLIDSTTSQWKENSIQVMKLGNLVAKSTPLRWWNNAIIKLTANNGTAPHNLNTASTVYIVDQSITSSGFNLNADKVALAVNPTSTITYTQANGVNCQGASAETTTPDSHCVVAAGTQNFLWVEGDFKGLTTTSAGSLWGIYLYAVKFSHIRHARFFNTKTNNIYTNLAQNNIFSDVVSAESNGDGIYLYYSSLNRLYRVSSVKSANGINTPGGFGQSSLIGLSFNNSVVEANFSNNNGSGVRGHCGTFHNGLVNAVLAQNNGAGVTYTCNSDNMMSHISAINNTGSGIMIEQSNNGSETQLLSANNGGHGLDMSNSATGHRLSQVALVDNAAWGVYTTGSSNVFKNHLIVGNNTSGDCSSNSNAAGLTNLTCTVTGTDGTSDQVGNSSTAKAWFSRTSATYFVGKVTTNDSINIFDTLGFAASVAVGGWNSFENGFRTFGVDGGAYPISTNRGRCTSNCRIWDWSLAITVMMNPFMNSSDTFQASNSAFQNGQTCPAAVNGNVTNSWSRGLEIMNNGNGNEDSVCGGGEFCQTVVTNYLVNAVEITNDDIGNDNGLCESDESCVYSPNFGAYQGHGVIDTTQTCNFQNGTVTNVKMHAFPQNGY